MGNEIKLVKFENNSKAIIDNMEEEPYGIEKEHAHKRAIELIPEEFFWSCVDEFAPFGSDEGDMALSEFRCWKKSNPTLPTYECLKWTIESVGEMDIANYNKEMLDPVLIQKQVEDEEFDDEQYIFTLDISVIATGFGQLVDEGIIDEANKPLIQIAIDRQKVWIGVSDFLEYKDEYIGKLNILERALKAA